MRSFRNLELLFFCTLATLVAWRNPQVLAFQTQTLHRIRRPTSLNILQRPDSRSTENQEDSPFNDDMNRPPSTERRFPPGMVDLTTLLGSEQPDPNSSIQATEEDKALSPATLVLPVVGSLLVLGAGVAQAMGLTPDDILAAASTLTKDPQLFFQQVIEGVQSMGPAAPFFYGIFYVLCELLAVPATPLALSAGYLFGLTEGISVVLIAGTVAASVGFFVGRTFLRSWVEGLLSENTTFRKLDKAIGKDGLKLLVLVRLSPVFPFALLNYVYGASSIGFSSFFWGTFLGFTPGTIAYVYTGMVGKEIMFGSGGQPWYIYTGGIVLLAGLVKLVTDVATGIVSTMEEDDESGI